MESNKIIIDLNKSMNACSFEETDIIHKAEFDRVRKLIDSKIKDNESKDSLIRGRYNDTITILGSRGSGKTSFLMSVLHYCEKERNKDIEIIELIDPTLIEEKGHIFLTLISLITDKVEKKLSKDECDPYCREYRQRKCWDDKLKKLAAGLPSIDIDNASLYSNWHDPEHVMKKGLEAVKAAKELEKNFNCILEKALKILGKKVFLIAFDDIDVNFNNGWKVLETIRKYLTSPHIITLLSGDIKLFSKAIRKFQWENLGSELLKWEGEIQGRIESFDEMVTEIESQYMQKIMKAPNRIHLLTIGEMLNSRGLKVSINNESNDIYTHYIELLNAWGIHNKYEAHSVASYLLTLPLRTQIQFMKLFEYYKSMTNKRDRASLLDITDTFVSDMYELGIDVEKAKSQSNDFCYITHKFLLENKILNETYQLLPTSGYVNYNAVLFSLYTMFIEHSKNNPSMFFEYWIAIATIKNLLTMMPYCSDQKKDTALVPTIEGLSDYSFIGQNKVYRDICSYLSTYIRASINNNGSENKAPWGGTIILKGLAEYAKKSSLETQDRIDVAFEDASLMKKQLACFPMSIALFAHKQQSIVIYSFYTLLGTIVELLKRYNVIKKNQENRENRKNRINDIQVLLKELSQIKDNVMPVFERSLEVSDSSYRYNTIIKQEQKDEELDLAEALCDWMDDCPECVPPHLIGKAATRSFYAMRNLDDKVIADEIPNLGDAMHRRIVIVMNSVLIEDVKENINSLNLTNNNPSETNTIFINNLKEVNREPANRDKLSFSQWLLACPLFILYLSHANSETSESQRSQNELIELWNNLAIFIKKTNSRVDESKIIEWCKEHSVHIELQQVSIYGSKKDLKKDNKIAFSLAKGEKSKKTIDRLATRYKTPQLLADKEVDEIRDEISDLFIRRPSVNMIEKLKNYCKGDNKTWRDVKKEINASK